VGLIITSPPNPPPPSGIRIGALKTITVICCIYFNLGLDKIDKYRPDLAPTFVKNATKPNPLEIIPLKTTRKENIWKTEEALARAVVTLETERIKGSNP